jgi:hypothetical protein
MCAWPSWSLIETISTPCSNKWVAKECRRVCTQASLMIPAFFHCQAEGLLHGTVAQWCAFQPAIEKVCLWFAALDVLLQALGDVRTEHHIAAFYCFSIP